MKVTLKAFVVVAAVALLMSGAAFAQSAGGTLTVNAAVGNSCSLDVSDMAFGAYDPIGANAMTDLPANATLTVRCTTGDSYTIGMDEGLYKDADSTTTLPLRQMTDGGTNRLAYRVYQDAALDQVWGGDMSVRASGVGTGSEQTLTAYGVLLAGQSKPSGNYSDQVTVTVYY
jgi:spore coat protein U-like protein